MICLKGILPRRYHQHWFLLVYGVTTYLKDKFIGDDYCCAKWALKKFVNEISILYPNCMQLYIFNVHLLTHIPESVKHWGSLWASSTSPYEHFNGVIARLTSGTRTRPEQVCQSYFRLRCISHRSSNLFRHPNAVDGKQLFDAMVTRYLSNQHFEIFDRHGGQLFGASERYELSLDEKAAIQHCLNVKAVDNIAQSFERLTFKGVVYHASCYDTLKERDNSTVKMSDEQMLSITRILLVKPTVDDADELCVILGELFELLNEKIVYDKELGIACEELVSLCHKTNRINCRKIDDLHGKCVQVPYGNAVVIVPLVNGMD